MSWPPITLYINVLSAFLQCFLSQNVAEDFELEGVGVAADCSLYSSICSDHISATPLTTGGSHHQCGAQDKQSNMLSSNDVFIFL